MDGCSRILSTHIEPAVEPQRGALDFDMIVGVRQIIGLADGLRPGGALEFGFWLHWSHSGATVADGATLLRAPGRNFEELPRSHPQCQRNPKCP